MWRDDVESPRPAKPGRGPARRWVRRGVQSVAVALVVGATGLASPASAHVDVKPSTTAAGAHAILEFSVGHGCGDSPTTKLTIQMPKGIDSVTPTRTALWKVEKKLEKLDPPTVDAHGNKTVQRVAAVVFSTGTPIPDGQRDVFQLSVQLPDAAEGTKLVFPTIQTCAKGESAWIEVPQDGQQAEELELPAPGLVISKAADGGHHHGASAPESHSGEAGSQSGAATAAAQTSDGADGLTIAALVAGILGCLLGGAALLGQRRRT